MMLYTYYPRTGRLRQEAHCMFESSLDYIKFWNSLGYRISVSPPQPKKKRRKEEKEEGSGSGRCARVVEAVWGWAW